MLGVVGQIAAGPLLHLGQDARLAGLARNVEQLPQHFDNAVLHAGQICHRLFEGVELRKFQQAVAMLDGLDHLAKGQLVQRTLDGRSRFAFVLADGPDQLDRGLLNLDLFGAEPAGRVGPLGQLWAMQDARRAGPRVKLLLQDFPEGFLQAIDLLQGGGRLARGIDDLDGVPTAGRLLGSQVEAPLVYLAAIDRHGPEEHSLARLDLVGLQLQLMAPDGGGGVVAEVVPGLHHND